MFIRTRTRVRLSGTRYLGIYDKPGKPVRDEVTAYRQVLESYRDADTGRPRQRVLLAWTGRASVAEAVAEDMAYREERIARYHRDMAKATAECRGCDEHGSKAAWLRHTLDENLCEITYEAERLAGLHRVAEWLHERSGAAG